MSLLLLCRYVPGKKPLEMGSHHERSALLANEIARSPFDDYDIRRASVQRDHNEVHGDGFDVDEDTLNHMMAKFSTSVGSLGLGGPIQGASLMRRGSVSTLHRPSIRRSSRANMEDYLDSATTLTRQSTRRSEAEHPRLSEDIRCQTTAKSPYVTTVDSVAASESQEPKRESRFLGGVSEARFWAIFSSILLVYFVSDQGHIGAPPLISTTGRLFR